MTCDGERHNLVDLHSFYEAMGDNVVRWCQDCGAVVIDRDYDNRTYPGYIMQMRFPRMTYPNQTKVDSQ